MLVIDLWKQVYSDCLVVYLLCNWGTRVQVESVCVSECDCVYAVCLQQVLDCALFFLSPFDTKTT